MKRFLVVFLVLAVSCSLLAVSCFAIDPYMGEQGEFGSCWSYFGQITDPTDTTWHPGHIVLSYLDVDSTIDPNIWGINLTQYKYLGIEVVIIQPDTTLNDSLLVDVWTGYYGHSDSLIVAVAIDSIADGVIFDTCIDFPDCPKAIKWMSLVNYPYAAGAVPYWFGKYAWIRLRTYMTTAFATDTTFTGEADTDGDLWAADGDSLLDWNSIGADGYFWDMLVETEEDSFVYVHGEDSLFAVAMNTMSIAQSPGTIDSVTFSVAYCESVVTVAKDTLRLGIAFGDTTGHHYDSLDIGLGGSGVLWSAQQALDSSLSASTDPRGKDTVEFTFTTDPHGNAWTRTTLDSCILIFDPVHVDTLTGANGTLGFLYIFRTWATVYHSRTELYPALKYRATIWLKE